MRTTAAVILAVLAAGAGAGDALYNMKPYPAPGQGMQRLVFRVPALDDEGDREVEIRIGRMMEVDCNRLRFMGTIEPRVAEGWGFPYYVLPEVVGPASTLMACPENEPKRVEFVTVGGDGFFVPYNSKLPVVVYVPAGYEVRYRIWAPVGEAGRAVPE
ncbi:MAG: serine protease inhibitor ecotin [Gammaproteobacteria bacterium]|nr:serine protease inhibitor ecotin [Gammaproteobacteria bacterium]